jgi:hypothetical protein
MRDCDVIIPITEFEYDHGNTEGVPPGHCCMCKRELSLDDYEHIVLIQPLICSIACIQKEIDEHHITLNLEYFDGYTEVHSALRFTVIATPNHPSVLFAVRVSPL